MDDLLSILMALIHWRFLISMLGSIVLAVLLSRIIPPFTAEYCIMLVIFGAAFGIYWQSRAEAGLGITEKGEGGDRPQTPRLTLFAGLASMGLVGGWFLKELFGSVPGGAVVLLFTFGVVTLFLRFVQRRPIVLRSFWISIAALLAGYSVALFLPSLT
jgi:hypothetical protein